MKNEKLKTKTWIVRACFELVIRNLKNLTKYFVFQFFALLLRQTF
jgi:hypothetical protein